MTFKSSSRFSEQWASFWFFFLYFKKYSSTLLFIKHNKECEGLKILKNNNNRLQSDIWCWAFYGNESNRRGRRLIFFPYVFPMVKPILLQSLCLACVSWIHFPWRSSLSGSSFVLHSFLTSVSSPSPRPFRVVRLIKISFTESILVQSSSFGYWGVELARIYINKWISSW